MGTDGPRLAVHEHVHEPALGRVRAVLAEQADLVAHAGVASLRDAQPGASRSPERPAAP